MGEAWAAGGTTTIATVGVIAVPHSGGRRTSTTKRRLAHRAVGSRIIKATSCACPRCQGASGAEPPLTGSCRRYTKRMGPCNSHRGFWDTTLRMTLMLWLCTLPFVVLIVLPLWGGQIALILAAVLLVAMLGIWAG
jgi:hypothetical protein